MAKTIYIYILLLFFFIFFAYSGLKAQQYSKSLWSMGLFAEYTIPNHITEFSALPGVPNCCPKFTGGMGSGFSVGALLQYRFYGYNNFFIKLSYLKLSAELSATETEWVNVNEKLTPAAIEHFLNTDFSSIMIEPMYKYNTIIGLSFSLGISAGYLFNSQYQQYEILVKPENTGTFENGRRIRNQNSGDIPEINSFISFIDMTLEYELPLDKFKNYILSPKFGFNYGINSLFNEVKWRITYFSFGFSLKYNPFTELSNPLEPN